MNAVLSNFENLKVLAKNQNNENIYLKKVASKLRQENVFLEAKVSEQEQSMNAMQKTIASLKEE